jgi:hypothetical protein
MCWDVYSLLSIEFSLQDSHHDIKVNNYFLQFFKNIFMARNLLLVDFIIMLSSKKNNRGENRNLIKCYHGMLRKEFLGSLEFMENKRLLLCNTMPMGIKSDYLVSLRLISMNYIVFSYHLYFIRIQAIKRNQFSPFN